MHIGTITNGVKTPSKTECIFFPPPGFFTPLAVEESHPETPKSINIVSLKPRRESEKERADRESRMYDNCSETTRITIDGEGFIDFTRQFTYLGSVITFDLRDDMDINKRISKAGQMMGALRNV